MTGQPPRTITLEPTFTNPRESKTPAPEPLTGLFYGKTEGWWFIHVDGVTKTLRRADWREAIPTPASVGATRRETNV